MLHNRVGVLRFTASIFRPVAVGAGFRVLGVEVAAAKRRAPQIAKGSEAHT